MGMLFGEFLIYISIISILIGLVGLIMILFEKSVFMQKIIEKIYKKMIGD